MKRISLAGLCMLVAMGAVVEAQVRPKPQTLLGVGQKQPATSESDASASAPFFDDTVLHEVRLTINSKDWQTLKENYLSNAYYPCDFQWGGDVVRNVGIRSRGTASRSGVKPGLRVDFDRYSDRQTFRGLKSFVLRNNTTDYSNLHERISMLFFARMGISAPREAHTRLYVNGAYAGLYSIVESIDRNFLARTRNEDDGYLYKFDRNVGDEPYHFDYAGPNQDLYVPHPFKPETHEADPQPQPIVDMIRTVAEASDAVFRSAIAEYLDLGAFIRHVAIETFLQDSDGMLGNAGMNNFYLYRPLNQHQHVFIPWDKSETMRNRVLSIFHNIDDVPDQLQNKLMTRAMAYPDLSTLYLDTLDACADSAGQLVENDPRGWMEREVDREYAQIREAALTDPEKGYTNDQFNQAIEDLRKFAHDRFDFVKTAVANKR
jgi:spore coat protein H